MKKVKIKGNCTSMRTNGKNQKFSMPKWMECTWRRLACNKKTCRICGRFMRDRQRHLRAGDDPDSMEAALEDVSRNFSEALENLKEWAEQNGIEITNLENIKEPSPPAHFPLYNIVTRWREGVMDFINVEADKHRAWTNSEQIKDLMWYANLLAAKTYRQLCNCWHIKEGNEYGGFDHKYTRYVLGECIRILKNSLGELVTFAAPRVRVGDYNKFSENEFLSFYIKLTALENKVLSI